jgi:ADP-ribosylglycohydrolase
MYTLLPELAGAPSTWKERSEALFRGAGALGNGAAMRVAPLGAYFADDLDAARDQAEPSAVVTHSHPEAVAGAIAVATAAALAYQHKSEPLSAEEFLQRTCQRTPASEVHLGIVKAIALPSDTTVQVAVAALGNGAKVSAQDTVPFSLWAAAHHLDDYQGALWTTVSGLGDRDTTCAIVGGIVAMSAGIDSIPPSWLECREPMPAWLLYQAPDHN